MDSFFDLIYGLRTAEQLAEYHNEPQAAMAIQFALDYFGAEEEDVTNYITWTNEGSDPEWEELDDD